MESATKAMNASLMRGLKGKSSMNIMMQFELRMRSKKNGETEKICDGLKL
jgi:hypothetical protein